MPRPTLPPDLDGINRMLILWSQGGFDVGPGGGGTHPLEVIRKMQEGATFGDPPIPEPEELRQIDRILLDAPPEVAAFIKTWYRNGWPVSVKAQRLGISRTTIYDRWKSSLRYVQGAMRARNVSCIA